MEERNQAMNQSREDGRVKNSAAIREEPLSFGLRPSVLGARANIPAEERTSALLDGRMD